MPERVPIERAAAPHHLSILVVDDEDLIRWSLKRALSRRGHHIVEAASAAAARQAVSTAHRPFDAILLDYRLPDSHDLTLLRQLRDAMPGTAVFMMTAFGEQAMRTRAREIGAGAVLDKPFRVADVVALVEAASAPPL